MSLELGIRLLLVLSPDMTFVVDGEYDVKTLSHVDIAISIARVGKRHTIISRSVEWFTTSPKAIQLNNCFDILMKMFNKRQSRMKPKFEKSRNNGEKNS